MNDGAVMVALLVAFAAGGLTVYILFALRPTAYDEPVERYLAGARVEHVYGGGARPRVLFALALLAACLVTLTLFVAGP